MSRAPILIASLALFVAACDADDARQPGDAPPPTDFSTVELPADGKADGLPLVCDAFVHKPTPDTTVVAARIVGRATPSSNTVPSSVPVDVAGCAVLEDRESTMSDCRFYDVCREQTVDCSGPLGRQTDATFLDSAVFSVTKVQNEGSEPRYYAENFNCHVVEITTATRDAALVNAKAMGLYFDHGVTFVRPEEATVVGHGKRHDGDPVTLHRFAGLSICWAGSMSSSQGQVAEFKPFLFFEDAGTCYVDWDANATNYAVSLKHQAFDRWSDVLQ